MLTIRKNSTKRKQIQAVTEGGRGLRDLFSFVAPPVNVRGRRITGSTTPGTRGKMRGGFDAVYSL